MKTTAPKEAILRLQLPMLALLLRLRFKNKTKIKVETKTKPSEYSYMLRAVLVKHRFFLVFHQRPNKKTKKTLCFLVFDLKSTKINM